ncbi:MAG: hypothetical protein HYY96_06765 [Candidatus Tectomicrobia bacterium]|nr:hypothetical protein [Candidatus Tectomicrobia bacterium]
MDPVIIYCVTGLTHLVYCVWSVRSLRALDYQCIEVIVGEPWEKAFLEARLGALSCEVIPVDRQGYGMWAYRPFALEQYRIKDADRAVVVCDADILWKQDPRPLFARFRGRAWVHKITSLDPRDLDMVEIAQRRIGLRTMVHYKQQRGLAVYPNYHLNCGLFMLPAAQFRPVLERWVAMIRAVPPSQMIMTEALLSLAYAELGVTPVCDRANIKHLGIEHGAATRPTAVFAIAETPPGMGTGYETAQHYYGNQRPFLHRDAVAMQLDGDHLLALVERELRRARLRRLRQAPARLARRLRRVLLG